MATVTSKFYEAVCETLLNAHPESATYTPTTPYTGKLPSKVVKKGSKGEDVKAVQTFLNWCMNPSPKLAIDGKAGSKTVAQIRKWQKKYKLKTDGVFGSQSRAKAKAIVDAHKPKPAPTPKPTPTKKTASEKIVEKAKEYAWPYGTDAKKYAYKTGSAKAVYKTALKKWMKRKAKISQTDCGYFVNTCVRASGVSTTFTALGASGKKAYPTLPSTMKVVHKGKLGDFKLQKGDILRWKKTNGHQHTVVYIGDGKIAHASRGHAFPRIAKAKPWNNSNVKQSTLQVLRAK